MNFDAWIQKVDELLIEETGFQSRDHVDWVWMFSFDSNDTPHNAVEAFLSETYNEE